MKSFAVILSISIAILLAILLPLIFSGERLKAFQARARQRRMADARMNARLLRLDI